MNSASQRDAERLLQAWIALEVLAPPKIYKRARDLDDDPRRIVDLTRQAPPWLGGGPPFKKNHRRLHQIVLGAIDMADATAKLLETYTDLRENQRSSVGFSFIGVITLDEKGLFLGQEGTSISSFAWGLPLALDRKLDTLGQWREAETALTEALIEEIDNFRSGDAALGSDDDAQSPKGLCVDVLKHAQDWLIKALAIPQRMSKHALYALCTDVPIKQDEPAQSPILNSFFLRDLERARVAVASGGANDNLQRYLGLIIPSQRYDLLQCHSKLAEVLHPSKMPLGRWPGSGRHALVSLQQAAVNIAATTLDSGGIVAVNGPPGTGKTTLLRDVLAHVVCERATILAEFADPAKAFNRTDHTVKKNSAVFHIHEVDERLRGFEMLVASTNNKAVENVSRELPGAAAIAEDAFAHGYFRTTATSVLGEPAWGLIAAVLGNASNRGRFRKCFWWDDDAGFARYLQYCSGRQTLIKDTSPDGTEHERLPQSIEAEQPPYGPEAARGRWTVARARFLEALKNATALQDELCASAEMIEQLATQRDALHELEQSISETKAAAKAHHHALKQCLHASAAAEERRMAALEAIEAQRTTRPGWLHRLLSPRRFRHWKDTFRSLKQSAQHADIEASQARMALELAHDEQKSLNATLTEKNQEFNERTQRLASTQARLQAALTAHGGAAIDDAFAAQSHAQRQQAIPWCDGDAARSRDALFEAALELHQAFIEAAATPLRHNLALLMDGFGTASLGSPEKDALLPHLWSSLFLVVPLVSTTFASVERLFARLGPDSLGWLLIDEAGQAVPQAAVGALMRCQRAVIVGDPLQIEPVVTLAPTLSEAICKDYAVDAARFNAPGASVQTLADTASVHIGRFQTLEGEREVGVPLLVHRRCAKPMFDIANAAAYENKMVSAKSPGRSAIRDTLGASCWFDIDGQASGKWSVDEGRQVLALLQQLKSSQVLPDLYIVTPFVQVQDQMRQMLTDTVLLDGWIPNPRQWASERVGTVHTVQGREAEAVIFLLGAPLPEQAGARTWAGGRPNLLNVAVSRAKEAIYVVGNHSRWQHAGVFALLSQYLPLQQEQSAPRPLAESPALTHPDSESTS